MGLCGSNKTVAPQYFDPLGPNAEGQHVGSGGPELRNKVFEYLPGLMQSGLANSARAANAAREGAAKFGQIGDYGQSVMRGNYLNASLPLIKSLQATRAAANQQAQNTYSGARADLSGIQNQVRSRYNRAGQTFGTGMQQAQESAQAALNADIARAESARLAQQAATEQQALLQNYMAERQIQNQAPAYIAMAAEKPFQMLSAVPSIEASGITPSAEILGALASGGSIVSPNTYYKPGLFDYALQGAGTYILGNAAGAWGGGR